MNLLESLLLAAHLLCVNVASGGPLVAAWLDWRSPSGNSLAARSARYLAGWSVIGLVAGAGLGIVIGWLKWTSNYRALWLGPLSYKLQGAGIEAVFSLVLLVGWWLWLRGRAGGSAAVRLTRGILALLAATNLLYHFPVLFSVVQRLHEAEQTTGEQIRGAAFRQLMVVGETPALAVHVVLASLAVAGVMLLGLALRVLREGDEPAAALVASWGSRWALVPSLAQLPVGLWTLSVLPATVQSQIMGANALGTLLFVAALGAAFWLVNDLTKLALGESARPLLIRAMAAMLVTVVLMTAMQQQARPRGVGFQPAVQHLQQSGDWPSCPPTSLPFAMHPPARPPKSSSAKASIAFASRRSLMGDRSR